MLASSLGFNSDLGALKIRWFIFGMHIKSEFVFFAFSIVFRMGLTYETYQKQFENIYVGYFIPGRLLHNANASDDQQNKNVLVE